MPSAGTPALLHLRLKRIDDYTDAIAILASNSITRSARFLRQ
jgi:hypothetical protein